MRNCTAINQPLAAATLGGGGCLAARIGGHRRHRTPRVGGAHAGKLARNPGISVIFPRCRVAQRCAQQAQPTMQHYTVAGDAGPRRNLRAVRHTLHRGLPVHVQSDGSRQMWGSRLGGRGGCQCRRRCCRRCGWRHHHCRLSGFLPGWGVWQARPALQLVMR
jgi:hypothetical protein